MPPLSSRAESALLSLRLARCQVSIAVQGAIPSLLSKIRHLGFHSFIAALQHLQNFAALKHLFLKCKIRESRPHSVIPEFGTHSVWHKLIGQKQYQLSPWYSFKMFKILALWSDRLCTCFRTERERPEGRWNNNYLLVLSICQALSSASYIHFNTYVSLSTPVGME